MTPHEEEMLKEIDALHARLSSSERSRLKWKVVSFLSVVALGYCLYRLFFTS